jgi:tRNA (guanine37-N1)-methyltransferase
MRIDVVTIFPEFFDGPLQVSIVGRALASGVAQVSCHDLRDWTSDAHRTVDDAPYGGGAGMVMKPEPFFAAVEQLRGDASPPVVAFTPCGAPLTQAKVRELAAAPHVIMLCGRYEGIDQRVHDALVTDEVSLGDYVLSGGELPALVLIDAIVRLLPGAVGNDQSPVTDSFSDGLLEHPHYTRPAEFRGMAVPQVLINGHHAQVARWRRRMSLVRTLQRRPELLANVTLSREDEKLLSEEH